MMFFSVAAAAAANGRTVAAHCRPGHDHAGDGRAIDVKLFTGARFCARFFPSIAAAAVVVVRLPEKRAVKRGIPRIDDASIRGGSGRVKLITGNDRAFRSRPKRESLVIPRFLLFAINSPAL